MSMDQHRIASHRQRFNRIYLTLGWAYIHIPNNCPGIPQRAKPNSSTFLQCTFSYWRKFL